MEEKFDYASYLYSLFNLETETQQAERLDDYWKRAEIKQYCEYLEKVKVYNKVFRDSNGKHIVKRKGKAK